MKTFSIILLLLISISCKEKNTQSLEKTINTSFPEKVISQPKEEETEKEQKVDSVTTKIIEYTIEIMKEGDVLFNGKLKRFFTLDEFKNVYKKPDSIVSVFKYEFCNYIFENEDVNQDLNNRFLFKEGSRFENSKEKVAVDEFKFTQNNFITYKGNRLDGFTTINDMKKIFPNAMKSIGEIDVYEEGILQAIALKEGEGENFYGHIKIFFKNDKLYLMHWWSPC